MSEIRTNKLGMIDIQLKDSTYLRVQSKCILLGVMNFEDVIKQADGKTDYANLYSKITPTKKPYNDIWYKIRSGDTIVFVADSWVATMKNTETNNLINVKLSIPVISGDNLNIIKKLLKTLNIDFSQQ